MRISRCDQLNNAATTRGPRQEVPFATYYRCHNARRAPYHLSFPSRFCSPNPQPFCRRPVSEPVAPAAAHYTPLRLLEVAAVGSFITRSFYPNGAAVATVTGYREVHAMRLPPAQQHNWPTGNQCKQPCHAVCF